MPRPATIAAAMLVATAVACGLDATGSLVVPAEGGAPPTPTVPPPGIEEAGTDAGSDADLDAGTDAAPDAAIDGGVDAGPITHVQSIFSPYSTATFSTAAITVKAGNALVVATYVSGTQTMSLADTLGNAFTSATKTSGTTCSGSTGQLWYVTNAKGGPDFVTVTVAGTAAIGITVAEYSGIAAAGALDVVSNGVAAAASNAMSAPSLTTTGSRDIIVSLFHDTDGTGTMTPGADYTARARDTVFYTLLQDDAPGRGPGVRAVTAALPAGTTDACWGAMAIALKAP